MTRLKLALVLGAPLLGLVACGGGDERDFAKSDAGTGATAGAGGSGGGASGSSGASGGGSSGTGGGSSGAGGGSSGTGGGSSGTGGAAGDAGVTCDTSSNLCAPDAESGWTGPIAFRKGAGAPPACPGSYGTSVNTGNAGLVPGTATCKCTCDPATGITGCTGTATVYDVGETVLACTSIPSKSSEVWSGNSSACSHPIKNSVGKVTVHPPIPSNPGSCAPKVANTIPTPTWSQQTRICSGATPATGNCSAGQTCMPQPGAPYEVCVYRSGDVACPTAYGKKTLVYEKFTDTRSCSACTCGSPSSSCGGQVNFASGCTGFPLLITSAKGCASPAGGIDISTSHWASYSPAPSGTCTEATTTLSGTVTPSGEATVCCM